MDPGSCLAVASLILQVVDVGGFVFNTIHSIKHDDENVRNKLHELQELNDLLEKLAWLFQDPEYSSVVEAYERPSAPQSFLNHSNPHSAITTYKNRLYIIRDELQKENKNTLHKFWNRVKRALTADEFAESMKELRSHCSRLDHQINIDKAHIAANSHVAIHQTRQELKDWRNEELNLKILSWISTFNFESMHDMYQDQRHESTGIWFLDKDEFLDWRNGLSEPLSPRDRDDTYVPPILWGYGMPGAGKSVLASTVIDHLRNIFKGDEDVQVAHIFCTRKFREGQTCNELISSILKQVILSYRHDIPEVVKEAYRQHGNGNNKMTRTHCADLIARLLIGFRRSFLVLDALDEYHDPDDCHEKRPEIKILEVLKGIIDSTGGKCRLFLTSRQDTSSQCSSTIAKRVKISADIGDLVSYTQSRIVDEKRFNFAKKLQLEQNWEVRDEIVRGLTKHVKGHFLLARLVLDNLSNVASLGKLKQSIADMKERPPDLATELKTLYDEAIQRIKSKPRPEMNLGLRLLAWLSHTMRPLKSEELQHAFATEPGWDIFDGDFIIETYHFEEVSAGLLEIFHGEVHPVHWSVVEYLKEQHGSEIWFISADRDIAETCMAYLSLSDFGEPCKPRNLNQRYKAFPFLKYAAWNFGSHASRCIDEDGSLLQTCLTFIEHGLLKNNTKESQPHPRITLGGLQVIASRILHYVPPERIQTLDYPIMHLSILCGLENVVRFYSEAQKCDIDGRGPKMETPLHVAVRTSSPRMVTLLLKYQANTRRTSWTGKSALDILLAERWQVVTDVMQKDFERKETAQMLRPRTNQAFPKFRRDLETSGLPKEILKEFRNVFEKRAQKLDAVLADEDKEPLRTFTKLLLAQDITLDISYSAVTSDDCEEIARLLIEHDVDVNGESYPEMSPLQLATLYRRKGLVELLLKKGANPFLKRVIGLSARELIDERLKLNKHKLDFEIFDLLCEKESELDRKESELLSLELKLNIPGRRKAEEIEKRTISHQAIKDRYAGMQDYMVREVRRRQIQGLLPADLDPVRAISNLANGHLGEARGIPGFIPLLENCAASQSPTNSTQTVVTGGGASDPYQHARRDSLLLSMAPLVLTSSSPTAVSPLSANASRMDSIPLRRLPS